MDIPKEEPQWKDYSHMGIFNDDWRAWYNAQHHPVEKLCKECGATGNEMYSMYRACAACGGKGVLP